MKHTKRASSGVGRAAAVVAVAVASAAWLIAPPVLATDPDGGSAPAFSGAPCGTPYAWAGTTPKDGVEVLVHDGRFRLAQTVAQCQCGV